MRFILIIDIIILLINISFFVIKIRKQKQKPKPKPKIDFLDNFRKVDYFPLKLISSSYSEISNYLLNKFFVKKKQLDNLNNESNNQIKTVKIHYINLHPRWISLIKNDLKGLINIEIDKENPDYLLYATFGCDYLNNSYNNTIKIAFFTENQIPDLSYADYTVGFAHISYLDRYFTYPFFSYHMNTTKVYIENLTKARENALKYHNRTKFCGAVISNAEGIRCWFIKELNNYKKVDMGGHYRNNVGKINNKIEFLSSYKFSIAMENSEGDGYLTEKIIDSFLAGTIPIYYGDYTVDEFINPKSFILVRDRHDILEKIEYIKKIDNDDELYLSILKEKIFTDEHLDKIDISRKNYFLNLFKQKKEYAKRTDNYYFGLSD